MDDNSYEDAIGSVRAAGLTDAANSIDDLLKRYYDQQRKVDDLERRLATQAAEINRCHKIIDSLI